MSIFRRKTLKEKYDEKLRLSIQGIHEKWREYKSLEGIAFPDDSTLEMQVKLEEKNTVCSCVRYADASFNFINQSSSWERK